MRRLQECERAARALWTGLNLEAPVDLKLICDKLGIEILRRDIPDLTPHFSALYARNHKRAVIMVNVVDTLYRQRFSVAHEIYHHMLIQDTRLPVHGRVCILEDSDIELVVDPKIEHLCNRFAVNLLMPRALVAKWYFDLRYNVEWRVSIMANRFGVSEEMIHDRFAELKLSLYQKAA
jgi:Zn-dependent peptidase ImmA (M78 family)